MFEFLNAIFFQIYILYKYTFHLIYSINLIFFLPGIDEKQISRLHMILKPFMLRRIKKDVENELSDKIEIMKHCPLTTRQKLLYIALKKKIRIEDLLNYSKHGGDGHSVDKNFQSNLMNLVMQFRKVCNHPELFERRDAKSPFFIKSIEYNIPRLIFDEGLLYRMIPSKRHLLYNKLSIFKAENIHNSIDTTFSFSRFINLSSIEIERLFLGNLIAFIQLILKLRLDNELQEKNCAWKDNNYAYQKFMLLEPELERPIRTISHNYEDLVFTMPLTTDNGPYTFTTHKIMSMPESMEHRIIRSKHRNTKAPLVEEIKIEVIDDVIEGILATPTTPQRVKSPLKSPGHLTRSPLKSPTGSLTGTRASLKSPTSQKSGNNTKTSPIVGDLNQVKIPHHSTSSLAAEFSYIPRPPRKIYCQATTYPPFLYDVVPRVQTCGHKL